MSRIGHNGFDSNVAKRWIGEILRVHGELEEAKIEHMNKCRDIRERLPDIYDSARNAGINIKSLKAAIKVARAKNAFENLVHKATPIDDEDKASFEYLASIAAPGDLFEAALRANNNNRPSIIGMPGADAAEA